MSNITTPLHSLQQGSWFKLICGASYQHIPAIRNLSLVYSLAGADCIDVAADPAVINTALQGIKIADSLRKEAKQRGFYPASQSWLMISINDGEDPHFRKAEFNPDLCPSTCNRPCLEICPADAIKFTFPTSPSLRESSEAIPPTPPMSLRALSEAIPPTPLKDGVIDELCYGCGRCIPVCPSNLIFTRSSVSNPRVVSSWFYQYPIDALEIHTQVGHFKYFKQLWSIIAPNLDHLRILAISCPYEDGVMDYLSLLSNYINPLPCSLIWQTDGRPMSGDIGKGTTHPAIKYAQQVLNSHLGGYVQLAGGTNQYTVAKLRSLNLLPTSTHNSSRGRKVAGVAYGSYARKLLSDLLTELEQISPSNQLENYPYLLWSAVEKASLLVSPLKIMN